MEGEREEETFEVAPLFSLPLPLFRRRRRLCRRQSDGLCCRVAAFAAFGAACSPSSSAGAPAVLRGAAGYFGGAVADAAAAD